MPFLAYVSNLMGQEFEVDVRLGTIWADKLWNSWNWTMDNGHRAMGIHSLHSLNITVSFFDVTGWGKVVVTYAAADAQDQLKSCSWQMAGWVPCYWWPCPRWPGVFDLQMLNSGHLNKMLSTYNWNIASQTILLLEIHSTFTLAGLVAALDGPLRVW